MSTAGLTRLLASPLGRRWRLAHPLTRRLIGVTFVATAIAVLCLLRSAAAPPPTALANAAVRTLTITSGGSPVTIWVPEGLDPAEPAPVVVALHGHGATADQIASRLAAESVRRGWILVAPTFRYGDWKDPNQLVKEDIAYSWTLANLLYDLPTLTGQATRPRAYVIGFSRGGQLAHRFAFFYPEWVRGVSPLSSGTYTAPRERGTADPAGLNLPFGLRDCQEKLGRPVDWADLRQVEFQIGVGAADNRDADVPRRWDALFGRNRVERATAFHRYLQEAGIASSLFIYPRTAHELTATMQSDAVRFFDRLLRQDRAA